MSLFRRIIIIFASIGWIVPLCLSFWSIYSMIEVTWRLAAYRENFKGSWHPFWVADELFYFSMTWLAFVLIGWSIALTRKR
jgi:hypothetical protein